MDDDPPAPYLRADSADWQITLPAAPAAIALARRFCVLFFAGTAGAEPAELIASELSTRALRHGTDAFTIRVRRQPVWGRIDIVDDGHGRWIPPASRFEEENYQNSGLGLGLVQDLADGMGHASGREGQVLWAEFSWPGGRRG